jgi:hypothetical protein
LLPSLTANDMINTFQQQKDNLYKVNKKMFALYIFSESTTKGGSTCDKISLA